VPQKKQLISNNNLSKDLFEAIYNKKKQLFPVVSMRNFRFRRFVKSGKNLYDINHEMVQKVVARKYREPE
jgi:hypothetical protein